jgi:DNA-binding LacI/PurR family transcriptional regulator
MHSMSLPSTKTNFCDLQEIAKRAGVSVATVSRTINHVPTVNPILARRVRRVIEEIGYYPNTHARAVVCGRSRTFGLIVSRITNPFFPEIIQTFEELGVENNYEILLSSTARDPYRLEVAARRMIERRVDAVAILTFGGEGRLVEILTGRNVPIFVADSDCPGPQLKTVQIDYQHGIRQAIQHLAALRHVRIAFIGGPTHFNSVIKRKTAFVRCMNEIRLEVRPALLIEGDHTMESGMKAMSELADLADRPTAVICSNDMTAIGVMQQAFQMGLRIPQDLSVIGFDDIRLAQFIIPPLTTVQMSQSEVATIAFRALLAAVECPDQALPHTLCPMRTNLVLRRSTTLAASA